MSLLVINERRESGHTDDWKISGRNARFRPSRRRSLRIVFECKALFTLGKRIKKERAEKVANGAFLQLKREYLKTNNRDTSDAHQRHMELQEPFPLLPTSELKANTQSLPVELLDPSDQQPETPRPRSALHAGDFAADSANEDESGQESPHGSRYPADVFEHGPLGPSPTTPWYTPPSSIRGFGQTSRFGPQETIYNTLDKRPWRNRAPSLNSYSSSSYVLKAPTTPLVQQYNNTDLDFSPRERSISADKSSRRRTLPPHAFHNMHSSSQLSSTSQSARHPPAFRREGSFSYGHHPRRSLTSNWSLQASSSPQTPPYLRSRRTSFSSEASPLQHAHMVGSYEESILRGWMSTAPSRPLDFTAQIGVLGRGKCKLKCPAHMTVPFPAVFYNWSSGNGRSAVNDDPSPYVGHIDLQHSLTPAEMIDSPVPTVDLSIEPNLHDDGPDLDISATQFELRKSKRRRRSSPSTAPPGGSYRIPQQGQLQIVIKNPNKTAVKLFLVPYDLEGMEPGTKTFVRQKSYSADPVIDGPQLASSSSEPALSTKKPTLRYLIDLKICSPTKGRFYLYQQIRVVFANRVPDDKEPLRNEIQLPQPKYSAYKPNRDSLSGPGSSAAARLTAEKTYRRRSLGFVIGVDGVDGRDTQTFAGGTTFSLDSSPVPPIPTIPFNLGVSRQRPVNKVREDAMELDSSRPTTSDDMKSPLSEKTNCLMGAQLSSSYRSSSSQGSDGYNKLIKGESGYGGLFARPGTPEPGEGLLAQRLKGFGIQRDATPGAQPGDQTHD